MSNPTEGDLRVWWIPQIPMNDVFRVPVETPEQGAVIIAVLAAYDLYQYEQRIKPDFSNAGGLEIFEDGEWCDWHSEEGEDLDEWMERVQGGCDWKADNVGDALVQVAEIACWRERLRE